MFVGIQSRVRVRLVALFILVIAAIASSGCGSKAAESPAATAPAATAAAPTETTPAPTSEDVTELKTVDLKLGTGAEAKSGNTVSVHYTGWLKDGTKFDSSFDRNEPFTFTIDGGQVIAGWDKGVAGMKVGGKRRLIIPASMGYGAQGAGGGVIPPNATLIFDVDLMGVQ